MRNLSKVLALVLSLAFVLTMFAGAIVTVPEAQNFTDEEAMSDAGYEAVMVLTALGIVQGYPDGSFQPAADVTRAEYAKMISVALAASDVAGSYNASSLPFNDYFDDWCIPYINFCYLNDIMVGYGDGYMLPKNNVTGFEAVKMTLVGLGYDPKIEGLEGSAWQNNTARLANKIGLLKNLESMNLYGAFGREATAILVHNAIYSNMVTYVANNAQATEYTLGEKVYDLLDIRGIVVANERGALGLNWTNAMSTDGIIGKEVAFMDYQNMATKGQTIFAFRDFTNASTAGGYYTPRIVRTAIASDFADLGRAYRVLTTGAKNPTNTAEVRKVYGVLWEISSADSVSYSDVESKLSDAKITGTTAVDKITGEQNKLITNNTVRAMFASAQRANANLKASDIQYNIWIDGVAKSYADASAHIAKFAASSAPYRAVDNDKDGVVDSLFLYTYTVAKVLAVGEDGKLTLAGLGVKAISGDLTGIVEGSYVAYYTDGQYNYADLLVTKVAKVSGYSDNSGGEENGFIDGIGFTYGGKTYTIDGAKYVFGSLSNQFDKDERAYFEQLMGTGSASVNDATLQFVFDDKYIVAVFVTDETYWENYAVVIGYNRNDVPLGQRHIRLYTDDNEYKDFYVASVDGNQIYNNIVSGTTRLPGPNTLVRYEEIGNNKIAIYNADYANASDKFTTKYDMFFDQVTGQWKGYEYENSIVQHTTMFNWNNGVVFVSYGYDDDFYQINWYDQNDAFVDVAYGREAYQWRAYWFDEFQPSAPEEARYPDAMFAKSEYDYDQVVYADSLNNVMTLKAAAIFFGYAYEGNMGLYRLPGLPLRAGQAIWGTIMGVTSMGETTEEGQLRYVYEVSILNPWSTGTTTITHYSDFKVATFVKGDIYKLFVDSDNICRRFEIAATHEMDFQLSGSDYLERGWYAITGIWSDNKGGYNIQIKFPGDLDTGAFLVHEETLKMPAGTDAYFTKGLFSTGITSYDYVSYFGGLGYLSMNNHKTIAAFIDLNPMTKEIQSIWFDQRPAPSVADVELLYTLASYDVNTREATYKVFYPTIDIDGAKAGAQFTVTIVQDPEELFLLVGKTDILKTKVTLDESGGWYVKDFKTDVKRLYDAPESYDKSNTQSVIWNKDDANDTLSLYTSDTTATPFKTYNINEETQIFWERLGTINSLNAMMGKDLADAITFWKTYTAGQKLMVNGTEVNTELDLSKYIAFDGFDHDRKGIWEWWEADLDAYQYNTVIVVADGTLAKIIVLVNNSNINTDANQSFFPYSATNMPLFTQPTT